MSDTMPPVYAFDPTGTNALNYITNEQQVLTFNNNQDFFTIIPYSGPFFETGLTIGYTPTVGSPRTLIKGTDYVLTHQFISASRACAKPIYGSVTINNTSLAGVITLSYQTVGGDWTISKNSIAAILATYLANPRITSWEEVANVPTQFPVINHEWNLTDMVGMSALISKLNDIQTALVSRNLDGLGNHLLADNPHHITPAMIGSYTTQQVDQMLSNFTLPDTGTAQTVGGSGKTLQLNIDEKGRVTGVTETVMLIRKEGSVTVGHGAGPTPYTVTYTVPFPTASNPPVVSAWDSSVTANTQGAMPVIKSWDKNGFTYIVKSYLAAPNDVLAGLTYSVSGS